MGSLNVPLARQRPPKGNNGRMNDAPNKHGIESRDFVDPHRLHFEQLGHVVHNADARPTLVLPLSEVEEGDNGCLLVLGRVMGDDFIGACKILRSELERDLR
jgi:hypothetical protein